MMFLILGKIRWRWRGMSEVISFYAIAGMLFIIVGGLGNAIFRGRVLKGQKALNNK